MLSRCQPRQVSSGHTQPVGLARGGGRATEALGRAVICGPGTRCHSSPRHQPLTLPLCYILLCKQPPSVSLWAEGHRYLFLFYLSHTEGCIVLELQSSPYSLFF